MAPDSFVLMMSSL